MTVRMTVAAIVAVFAYACATAPPPQAQPDALHGIASWYGQEYAGRTTANGEIFDPLLLTAAHRTLPFGTVIDVQNSKTGQIVRVRVNDRGPYIGGRVIDLSYAAAQQIALIDPGSGEVDIRVVKLGNGEREPPAPYVVTIPDVKPLPLPATTAPSSIPAVVDKVQVIEEHQGVETRKQVSPDGRRVEEVPVKPIARRATTSKFVVQVGAFAQETNARRLMQQLSQIGQSAHIETVGTLYIVRLGPFDTRDQAISARAQLETAGLSAIVVVAQ